jgi:ABC-type multidrug transport system fused ATPase/permease subunit
VASISGRFALIGLGDELPTVSLRTVDDQLRILEAVAAAVAKGKTSGLVAHPLVTIVRAANQILVTD